MEQPWYSREIIGMVPDLKPINVGFFSKIILMHTQAIFLKVFETCSCLLLKTVVEICLLISQNEILWWLQLQIVIINKKISEPTFMGFSASF